MNQTNRRTVKPDMTEPTDIDALIAVLRKGDGNGCRQPTEAMRTAAEHLDELQEELRQERERAVNGSCWDDGPQIRTAGGCDPMPPKCELRAGHLGAHRGGKAEWMRNPSSFNQVAKERDEAQSELARAREVIDKALEMIQPAFDHDGEYSTSDLIGARKLLAACNQKEKTDG